MNPRWMKYFLMDETAGVPASGGGSTPTPGSDVDWVGESQPDEDDVPSAAKPEAPKVETPTPTPAATPSTPTPAPAAPVAPAPSAPVTPVAPAAPVAPVAQTPPVPAPVVAPVAPVTPTPEPAPTPPAPAAPDLAALRSAEVTRLTGVFQSRLTEDVARGLLVEPEKHLPAILAAAQVDTMDAVIQHMYASLPGLIQNLTQQATVTQQAENAFFQAWPALNQPQYKQTVEHAIRSYRSLNPRAPRDEIIRAAGLTAMITHRLPLPPELFAPQAPVAPVVPAPSFSHAAPSASAPVAPPAGTNNPFVLLNEDFDREERG